VNEQRRSALTDVLERIADRARPARVAADTWPKGVRRHRIRVAGAALVAVVAVAIAATAGAGVLGDRLAEPVVVPGESPQPVIPSTVYGPVFGEDTVIESPPGPAGLVVSGSNAFSNVDWFGYEARSLVVAQNGAYRLVHEMTHSQMDSLLLAPDGGRLAGSSGMEGADRTTAMTAVLDLRTGAVARYPGGYPIQWAPDGRSILTHEYRPNENGLGHLRLLDLQTGQARELPRIPGRFRVGHFAAFSPDSARIAVAVERSLYVVNLADNSLREVAPLTEQDRLAGPGAWLPDGKRLAVYRFDGCEQESVCDSQALANRVFRIRYLDADTNLPATGPELAPAIGMVARLLGWQRDGAAVVSVHFPEPSAVKRRDNPYWSETEHWTVRSVELSRFPAGGGQPSRLVDLPSGAQYVDVPHELMDSFGGPSRSAAEGTLRWLLTLYWPVGVLEAMALVVAVVAVVLFVRRRRRR
jgi:hypothetical protein